ncbi:MAG: DUF882 domain-containing protein [Labilithrix sp.]|nr:DUF882 domain-containing protein [Labilithrix sp.]
MMSRLCSASFALAAVVALPCLAQADVQHTVARGHTIEAIANRYRVTPKQIIEANRLKDVKKLRIGEVLTIPTKDMPASAKAKLEAEKKKSEPAKKEERAGLKPGDKVAKNGKPTGRETTTFAMKPKTPGVVHIKRVATTEEAEVRIGDKRGRVSPTALKSFEKLLRSPSGMAHPIDARLVTLLGIVSNHFGSRKIEVVSGFRPFTPTQYTAHSNHNHGKAIDFRVVGVPNEAVRDFCRTLKDVGCGYYPNSVFVHMDVRSQSAFWIDYSKPGEAPRYNAPNVDADEGTSDVHDEGHASGASTDASPAPSASPSPAPAPAPAEEAPSEPPATPPTGN